MTSAFDPDDLGVVDELLAGMDAEDAESLRPVLSELRGLAESEPVLPNRRISSLLTAEAAAPTAQLGTVSARPQPVAPGEAAVQRESEPATVVDLQAARSARRDLPRRRRGRPAMTALIIAITAGAASAGAAAVAQDGFHLWPGSGTAVDGGSTSGHEPSPTSPGSVPAQLAPAAPAQTAAPTPSDTTAPATLAPESSRPASPGAPSAPAPASKAPVVPLPELPLSPPPLAPSTAPTVPQLSPAPTPPSLLPGLLPRLS